MNTTSIPGSWRTYSLSIAIDSGLVGQILQIGFSNTASNYEPSAVFYDNINFDIMGPVSVEASSWARTKSLYR